MVKIKICGLKNLEDIDIVNEAGIDFAGFIFAPKSKRYITAKIAMQMKQALHSEIKSVGVFVDEKIDVVEEIAMQKIIDLIQLHGNETNEYIEKLHSIVKLPIIKAFKADKFICDNIENTKADYVLIDSADENTFGGTGKTFDYKLIPKTYKPIFLAGGLNIFNIQTALKTNSFCVDINSGVETNGNKDRKKVLEIVSKIRN